MTNTIQGVGKEKRGQKKGGKSKEDKRTTITTQKNKQRNTNQNKKQRTQRNATVTIQLRNNIAANTLNTPNPSNTKYRSKQGRSSRRRVSDRGRSRSRSRSRDIGGGTRDGREWRRRQFVGFPSRVDREVGCRGLVLGVETEARHDTTTTDKYKINK